ncbi:MAG: hypothetical protein IJP68_08530 [Selenomonadaceae bacterium]|nr:hypothetical protein [Selenomonadaceae bacterium]
MKKMTDKIMRTLNGFAEIASEEVTAKMAWRAEAEDQLAQAKKQLNDAKTAAEIEEAGDARRIAWGAIQSRDGWVKWAKGYQAAVELITKRIQDIIAASQEDEATETEEEELSDMSEQDDALSA